MPHNALGFWIVAIALVAFPKIASAQPACGEGRISSAATSGHCCWPDQHWNEQLDRCTGAPNCPGGWVGEGSSCVRVAPVAPVAVAPVVTSTYAPAPTISTIATQPRTRRGRLIPYEEYRGGPIPPYARLGEHRRTKSFSWGVFVSSNGSLLAAFGTMMLYLGSVAPRQVCYAGRGCQESEYPRFAMSVGLGTFIPGLVLAAAGVALMRYGRRSYPVLWYNHGGVTGSRDRSPQLYVLPGAGETLAGLTIGISHF